MTGAKTPLLHVVFDLDKLEMLNKWKDNNLKYGIKKRLQELIEEDLKKSKK